MWWLIIPAVIAIFAAVILIRTAAFKPKTELKSSGSEVVFDKDAAVEHLARMIRVKTVSYNDLSRQDEAEFERFRKLLRELYPTVFEKCELEKMGRSAILLKLKGENEGDPSVFMAHYDVVPPNADAWEHDPFCGEIIDGSLWGRGALDTKCTLLGVMEAAETLLKDGFIPKHDIYYAFSGDEETSGYSAEMTVDELKKRGVHPAFVLDEGGAVVENVFPGVSDRCALIGIAEKGPFNIEMTLNSSGGHASTPPARTIVGRLSDAVTAVETHPFKCRITKPVAEMFDTLGRRSTFVYRMIFANLWLFNGVLDGICKKSGGELNAMMRTTCAFTMMQGSDAYNVLPPKAVIGANLRIMPGETMDTITDYLKKTVKNDDISITRIMGMNPSRCSETDCEQYTQLSQAIKDTWTDALVSPYLMLACSDARQYAKISEYVYRFSAMALSKEERGLIHGNNERIPIDTIHKIVEFYIRIMKVR